VSATHCAGAAGAIVSALSTTAKASVMLAREIRVFTTSHLLLYRAPGPGPKPPCPPTGVVHAGHAGGTGHAGAGAPLDPGDVPVHPTLPPPAVALSSDTAPVIESGPEVVGDWLHGTVAS